MLPSYYKQLEYEEKKHKMFSAKNTVNFKPIKYTQKCLITSLFYDYHGKRIACSSSDHSVQIWDSNKINENNLVSSSNTNQPIKWIKTGHWTAHYGAVLKVLWLPPYLGQFILSSGADGYVKLWMETLEDTPHVMFNPTGSKMMFGRQARQSSSFLRLQFTSTFSKMVRCTDNRPNTRYWQLIHVFDDSTQQITDIQLAYKKNLPTFSQLMLVSSSVDGVLRLYDSVDPNQLHLWCLKFQIQFNMSISSISWLNSFNLPLMVAIGFNNHSPKFNKPNIKTDSPPYSTLQFLMYNKKHNRWFMVPHKKIVKNFYLTSIWTESVNAVSFCPDVARPYSLLAIASNYVRIIRVLFDSNDRIVLHKIYSPENSQCSNVLRLKWNDYGTMIASSGFGQHSLRVWFYDDGEWKLRGYLASKIFLCHPNNLDMQVSPILVPNQTDSADDHSNYSETLDSTSYNDFCS